MHVHTNHTPQTHPSQIFLAIAVNLCLLFSPPPPQFSACTKNVFDFFPFNFFSNLLGILRRLPAHIRTICVTVIKNSTKIFGETIKNTFHAVPGSCVTNYITSLPVAALLCCRNVTHAVPRCSVKINVLAISACLHIFPRD